MAGTTATVFVVDDDPSIRGALGDLFASVGLRVELFGSPTEFLQAARPDWHQSPPSAVCRHYATDVRDPKRFYVWPPQPDPAGFVMVVYQGVPDDVGLGDFFPLPDLYAEAAYLFVLYHVLLRRDHNADPQRAMVFYQMFMTELDQDVKNISTIQAGKPDV